MTDDELKDLVAGLAIGQAKTDILGFFKPQGKSYQTMVNAILKSYVAAQKQ